MLVLPGYLMMATVTRTSVKLDQGYSAGSVDKPVIAAMSALAPDKPTSVARQVR